MPFNTEAEQKLLDDFEGQTPAQLQAMIAKYNFAAFRTAARNGHLHVLEYLAKKAPRQIQAMMAANIFEAFWGAAGNGHLHILEYLAKKAPDKVEEMVAAQTFEAFRTAARNGHLHVLEYLAKKAPVQTMIAAVNFDAFRGAARNGHLKVLEYLAEKTPVQAMIAARDFEAFRRAAGNGQLHVLEYLAEKAPVQAMIAARDFEAFSEAVGNGHLKVLEYLAEKAPDKVEEMIAADNFAAFRRAAGNGHLKFLEYLAEKAPVHAMIAARDFEAFSGAAGNGHLNVLEYLAGKAPDKVEAMIAADDFAAFRGAARNGHLHVLKYLAEQAPDQVEAMIAAFNFDAFRGAVRKGHLHVVNHLLPHTPVLAFAEAHVQEYGRYVTPYITGQLESLHAQKQALEENNRDVFDVDLPTARRCFYMLRNLIRRNEVGVLDEIRFLLSIPAVKNLAHTEVSRGQSNELLRLALRISNTPAAEILLNLPEVRSLAESNDYYRNEVEGGLDLRGLAQNRESSMTALSTGEQRRLNKALAHYNPTLKQEGMVPSLMTALKELLTERYNAHPATIDIVRDGVKKSLALPLAWEDFLNLSLNSEEKEAAYKAYYQHLDHTAWRYLSKPNPWMHPHAGYVYISDDHRERWSTFEEYQPLIALLFLAAKDEQMPVIDGFTFETRLDNFIRELALIGRAHNWDNTRPVMNAEGIVTDDEGNPAMEEYDDLEGDRPSCFSGVKRRLFQSVLGHPLLNMLTQEIIKREIRDFVRQRFEETIAANDPQTLRDAWNALVEEGDQEAIGPLKVLDISVEQQQQFMNYLETKYVGQFAEDLSFKKLVVDAFKLTHPEKDAHAVHFGYVGLAEMLEKAKADQANKPQTKTKKRLKESKEVKGLASTGGLFSDTQPKKQPKRRHTEDSDEVKRPSNQDNPPPVLRRSSRKPNKRAPEEQEVSASRTKRRR